MIIEANVTGMDRRDYGGKKFEVDGIVNSKNFVTRRTKKLGSSRSGKRQRVFLDHEK